MSLCFNFIGAASSTLKFIDNPNFKNGVDVVMSGVAFIPAWGWMVAVGYFMIDQTVGWDNVVRIFSETATKFYLRPAIDNPMVW